MKLSDSYLEEILDHAECLGSGARGLQTAVENMMQTLLFRLAEKAAPEENLWEIGGSS